MKIEASIKAMRQKIEQAINQCQLDQNIRITEITIERHEVLDTFQIIPFYENNPPK